MLAVSSLSLSGVFLYAQDSKPPDPTPLSNEVNANLPGWLHFSGEERTRMEYIVGENFKSIDDLYLLNRLRLTLDVLPTQWLKFRFQTEDSRVFGQNTLPAPASQKDSLDLRLGYAQAGADEGPASLRVGRQSLDFGEGRVLGDPNWSNVGRSFDAVRLSLRRGQLKLDLFSATAVKIDPTQFDQPTPGEHFDGVYGSIGGLVKNALIEPYVFWRMEHNYKNEGGRAGNLSEKTVGFRWAGKLPLGFDYSAEFAGQMGSYAGDSVGAWMGHLVVGNTLPDDRHRPRFFVEYTRASGDANPKDGSHGTFDSLFPSPHDKFGLTDLFCNSNIVYVRAGLQYRVYRAVTLAGAYNNFWLASPRDGLYVSAKVLARSANGAAGTHVGEEADLQTQWTISRATQLSAGYGRLFPGEFLQRATAGMPYNIIFLNIAQRF